VRHPARWIALTVAVVVVAFAVVLATQVGDDPRADATRSRLVGKTAPAFTVRALDGQPVTSQSLAGRAVIVNFWNSWCIPCQEELPTLQKFYAQHADDPTFAMVGIVRSDTMSAVKAYVRAEDISWMVGFDPDAAAALAYGTRGQPETFAITPDGVIAGAQIGPTSRSDLDTMLAAARGQPT
jgi:cytochrome c biogenesis protein CcmG, thiol:disulfide interchange protein DsbE